MILNSILAIFRNLKTRYSFGPHRSPVKMINPCAAIIFSWRNQTGGKRKTKQSRPGNFGLAWFHCFALLITFRTLLNAIWTWMDKLASRSNNVKAFVSNVARIFLSKTVTASDDSSSLWKLSLCSIWRCFDI